MTERLSEETQRMCRMCTIGNINGRCNLLNSSIATQNKLAEDGECTNAEMSGPTTRFPDLFPPEHRYSKIVGRMKKLENNDWVFQGGTFVKR